MEIRGLYQQVLHNGRVEHGWASSPRLDAELQQAERWLRLRTPTHSRSPGMLLRIEFPAPVSAIALPPPEAPPERQECLAVGCDDGTIHVCDPRTGAYLRAPDDRLLHWQGHEGSVTSMAWHSDGRLASADTDGWLAAWDLIRWPDPLWRTRRHEKDVICIAWRPDGRLVSLSKDRIWCVSDPGTTEEPIWQDQPDGAEERFTGLTAAAWHPDGRLATCGFFGQMSVYDTNSGEMLWEPRVNADIWTWREWNWAPVSDRGKEPRGKGSGMGCVALHPDGRLASGSEDGTVRVWDPSGDAEPLWQVRGHEEEVTSVAWHEDGRLASCAGMDAAVWEPSTGTEPCWRSSAHITHVTAVAWHPDGRLVSYSGREGTVKLWDPGSNATRVRWGGASHDRVTAAAWHPNGRLASGSREGVVAVWDLDGGEEPVWRVHLSGVSTAIRVG